MKPTTKPMPMKLKTYNVFHGQKQIGQEQAANVHDAYAQAREHHKIPLAVISRKEKV